MTWTDPNGKPQQKQAEKVLVAVGRSPRTADIGLDKTNIKPDRGFIMTNEWMETTEPGVYAIGDIVGGMPLLAHSGSHGRPGRRRAHGGQVRQAGQQARASPAAPTPIRRSPAWA